MKRLFTLIGATVFCLTTFAQRQIQNGGFEAWDNEDTDLVEPTHWNSFKTASGNLNSMGKKQIEKITDAHSGNAAVRIYASSILGVVAQGNLTTGRINMGSTSATDANGNYNYTDEESADFQQPFTGLPDAISLWAKASCQAGGGVSCNLHTKGYFQDPAGNTITATRIAKAENIAIPNSEEWNQIIVPFNYDVTDGRRPAYALLTLTTSGQAGKGSATDWMIIDDIEFIYYSDLRAINFNGKDIKVSGTTINIDGTYDKQLLQLRSGQGASISTNYHSESRTLTVTIKGEDISENPTNKHTYTLIFSGNENIQPVEPDVNDPQASLVPYGDFEKWKTTCGTTRQTGTGGGDYTRPGTEPEGWNGANFNFNVKLVANNFKTDDALVQQTSAPDQQGTAVKLTNRSASHYGTSVTFPAYITYAQAWLWSGYVNFKNTDTGVAGGIAYNKRPDAIRGQFRRANNGTSEDAHIIAYLWKGTFVSKIGAYDSPSTEMDDVERAIMGHTTVTGGDGQLIAACDYAFAATKDNGWETITVPLDYVEGQENTTPEKLNIIITSGDYWSRNSIQDNSLEADNIQFLFYSQLATATYDGKVITFDENRQATINDDYDASKLMLTATGRSATILTNYDDQTRLLTIQVRGGDFAENPDNVHTYTIHFLFQEKVVAETPFKDLMQITINDYTAQPEEATITIQEWNTNEKSLILPNFILNQEYYVGTIIVKPIDIQSDGSFSVQQDITILPGDNPADAQWIGPALGQVPINMQGQLVNDSLHVHIQIDLIQRINQYIDVLFGKSLIDAQNSEPHPQPHEDIKLTGTHTYADNLVVTVNQNTTEPRPTDITVTFHDNNTLDLSLKNFTLKEGDEDLYIGNVELNGVPYQIQSGKSYATFSTNQVITIESGDNPQDALWMGPMLGEIPVKLNGKVGTEKLYCNITINMGGAVGDVQAVFGTDENWPENPGAGTEDEEDPILRDYTYTDLIVVTVNGESNAPQESNVCMTCNPDNTINLTIKNFYLKLQDETVAPLGNIEINNIQPIEVPEKHYYLFQTEQSITIQNGDNPDELWLGPYFGDIPVNMSGKIALNKLYCNISIYLAEMKENIQVVFGENFTDHIPFVKNDNAPNQHHIYTLSGLPVRKITKPGIYIIDGHKKNFH